MNQQTVDQAISEAFVQYGYETDREGWVSRQLKSFDDEFGDMFQVSYIKEDGIFCLWKKHKFFENEPIKQSDCEVFEFKPIKE